MSNPWLHIPLSDYEGHMALPAVAQGQLLSDLFAEALARHAPESVAVLGCAGGNGFGRIRPEITGRVVGVDLNADYLRVAHARFHQRLPGLELYQADLQTWTPEVSPVELVFAGLVFEYVDLEAVLDRIRTMLLPGGHLTVVLQLPSETIAEVSPTSYTSLQSLSPVMRLVPPAVLSAAAAARGFLPLTSKRVPSAGGKWFQVEALRLPEESSRP